MGNETFYGDGLSRSNNAIPYSNIELVSVVHPLAFCDFGHTPDCNWLSQIFRAIIICCFLRIQNKGQISLLAGGPHFSVCLALFYYCLQPIFACPEIICLS